MLVVFCVCGCFCTRQRKNVFVTQGVMLKGLSTTQCPVHASLKDLSQAGCYAVSAEHCALNDAVDAID